MVCGGRVCYSCVCVSTNMYKQSCAHMCKRKVRLFICLFCVHAYFCVILEVVPETRVEFIYIWFAQRCFLNFLKGRNVLFVRNWVFFFLLCDINLNLIRHRKKTSIDRRRGFPRPIPTVDEVRMTLLHLPTLVCLYIRLLAIDFFMLFKIPP